MELASGSSSSCRSSGGGGGRVVVAAAITSSPEKKVNRFVRAVALIRKLGHTLRTLVFTWATVVLLGGYPTVLDQGGTNHFFYVVAIVSLEALRMFNRENSMDYQLFFRSKGSVKHLGWNGLVVVAWLSNVLILLIHLSIALPSPTSWKLYQALVISMMVFTALIGKFLSSGALGLLPVTVQRFVSLTSPVAAVLLLIPSLVKADIPNQSHIIANWVIFTVLLVTVFLLTASRLRFSCVVKLLVDTGLGNKYVFWRRLILNICMFAELVMLVFINDDLFYKINMASFQIYVLLCVSSGNILMPAAFIRARIALSRLVLLHNNSSGGSEEEQQESRINLEPSLDIFYVMVLSQGILHLVSCTLEMFSFLPRRSLAHQGGFRGQLGSEAVNLYYEYALEKCMENNDVAARKQMSLGTFTIHSISSDSPKLQLHGVWMMYNLLCEEPSRTQVLSKLHRDENAIARLINMLEWRSPEDATIRLFAAKVTASAMLAGTLQVVSIPGAIRAFSTLLDAHTDGTETEDQDSLPGLALSIFDSLASSGNYDFHNSCLEISKAAEDLIPKIVRFACYKNYGSDMQEQNTNEAAAAAAQKKIFLMESALQLLGKLSSISGKIGVSLRHELMEHPVLLTNLSVISEDTFSSQKARKIAAVILSNLTM